VKEGSFDLAFAGADYVLHCASPVLLQSDDPQRQLVDPAVNGTLNVLRAALKSKTVKRVVVTSSMAAIYTGRAPADPLRRYTESDWNLESSLTDDAYRYSKRLAEQAAWNFVKEHSEGLHFDLVVLNPSFILGPALSTRTDSPSVGLTKALIDGQFKKEGTIPMCPGIVHVNDVALAHALALEKPEAGGNRFILASSQGYSFLELARLLDATEFASYPLPTTEKAPVTYRPLFDNSKSQSILGIKYASPEAALLDTARWLVDNGIVERK